MGGPWGYGLEKPFILGSFQAPWGSEAPPLSSGKTIKNVSPRGLIPVYASI